MRKQAIDEMDSRMGPADVILPLTEALGLSDMAMNYYELGPGDSFAFGYHSHSDQEEVFYVLEGTVTFESADGEVAVEAGEAVRFGPGESQRGVNRGDDRVRALAIGAPQDAGETTILRDCVNCGGRTPQTVEITDQKDAVITLCLECGFETGRFE